MCCCLALGGVQRIPCSENFFVNTDLDANMMQGSKPHSIRALVVYLKGMHLPQICLLWFVWASSLSWGKLIYDLSPTQFNSLVKVLSLSSTERDFRHLQTLSNL